MHNIMRLDNRELYEKIMHASLHDGITVKINKKDEDLARRIEIFRKEYIKREIFCLYKENYGVDIFFMWDKKYGFVYELHCFSTFRGSEPTLEASNRTFDDYMEATKKQLAVLRKARHQLACMIRLKEKLKLPGPVQKIVHFCQVNNKASGDHLFKLSDEEMNDILKY